LDLRTYAHNLVEHALRESLPDPWPKGLLDWFCQPLGKLFNEPACLSAFIKDVANGARLLKLELIKTGNIKPREKPEEKLAFTAEELRSIPALTGEDLVIIVATYLGGGLLPDISPPSADFSRISDSIRIDASPRPPGMSPPREAPTRRPPGSSPPSGWEDLPHPASPPRAPAPPADLLDHLLEGATPEDNTSVVRVFYATDRAENLKGSLHFDADRSASGKLNYGECLISFPKIHKKGNLETPSILKLEFRPDPEKHIVLQSIESFEEAKFLERLAAQVSESATKEAFIFVHGYYVSFENAARRTGQLAFDLEFVGAPIFYSWPSNGKFKDYLKDETNVAWSTPHFQRFLGLVSQHGGAKRVHIIAHSMGNRAVCDALKALSIDPNNHLNFNHLVLAAPDIDADTFRELAEALQKVSGQITLYESSNDKAIHASRKIHGNPRAGEPLLIIPGLETVDASKVDTDFLGHSYFGETWTLLADIHTLLSEDKPAGRRFGLRGIDDPGGKYYEFKA
jgi:esterase/lipase superfamily enzyme